MGLVKRATQYFVEQGKKFQLRGVNPDWEMHPSWIAGIEGLNSYNQWVCEVVMPIAFQWIEEHKTEVYASIAEQNKDDVGVVIASAFEIVKTLSSYQNGLKATAQYEKEVSDGTFDPAGINPVWSAIVKKIREGTHRAFEHGEKELKEPSAKFGESDVHISAPACYSSFRKCVDPLPTQKQIPLGNGKKVSGKKDYSNS